MADMVLQLNVARKGIFRLFKERGIPTERAYLIWRARLRWWSYRVPAAFLALALIGWLTRQLVPSTYSASSIVLSVSLLFSMVSALRLVPLRDTPYEQSPWFEQDQNSAD